MKVRIYDDALYPCLRFGREYGREVEISEDKMKEYKRIFKEFYKMQKELQEFWKNTGKEAKK